MANPFDIAVVLRLVDQLTGPLGQATAAVENVDRVAKAAQGLRNFGQQAAVTGAVVSGAGAAIAASLSTVVNPAASFEAAMDAVGAIGRASDDELARLTETARMLGGTTWASASQAADGMRFLAAAGFAANQTIAAMPGMLDLARASGAGLASTADVASNILTGFGLEAAEMGRVADAMTATFTRSNVTLGMLGETMSYAAPAAAGAGQSLETVAAMAGKLGDAGIQGSRAGTAINAMLSSLAGPTTAATKLLDSFGVATTDSAGNLRNMVDILTDLAKGMEGMGNGARLDALATIFGREAAGAVNVLLDQTDGRLQDFVSTLESAGGEAAAVALRMGDNFEGAMAGIGSAVESVQISFGTLLLPALTEGALRVADIVRAITVFVESNRDLARTIGLVAAGVAAAAVVIGPAVLAVGALASAAGMLLPVLAALVSPIGLLIAALAGAAVLIHRNWDGIAAFFEGLWVGIVAGMAPLQPAFDALAAAVTPILDAGAGVLDWVRSLIAPVDGLAGAAAELGQSWGAAIGGMAAALTAPWLTETAALVASAWGVLPAVFDAVGSALGRLRDWGQAFFAGWIDGFRSAFDLSRFAALSETLGPLGSALGVLGTAVAGLFDRLAALFAGTGDATGGLASLGALAGALAGGALNTLADLIAMVATVLTGLTQALAGVLSGDFGAVVAGWQTALGGVLTFFDDLVARLTGLSLYDAGAAILQGLADGLSAGASAALAAIEGVGASIIGRFKALLGINSPSTLFAQFGQWIMDGLAKGLTEKVQAVLDTVSGVAGGVVGKFKSLLGINSPSTVFAGFGLNIVEGLENGINDNGADAAAAAAGLSRAVTAAAAAAALALPLSVSAAAAGIPDPGAAARAMVVPAVAPLADRGDAMAGGGIGGASAGGGAPVTVNLSVTLDGGDPDVVRRLEEWVRGDGGRLIAEAVHREDERRARTAFDPRGRGR
ncbi:phage tail tape measure protein [Azospirillum halopraeferens]|uniref:phage tail tape measure protein n=1 Tax=Azospirillum halopraeferens TaxID=34010 RepID=UPI00041E85EF|nr:phage tail tape measure protein [Azospirillum halopraeferens]